MNAVDDSRNVLLREHVLELKPKGFWETDLLAKTKEFSIILVKSPSAMMSVYDLDFPLWKNSLCESCQHYPVLQRVLEVGEWTQLNMQEGFDPLLCLCDVPQVSLNAVNIIVLLDRQAATTRLSHTPRLCGLVVVHNIHLLFRQAKFHVRQAKRVLDRRSCGVKNIEEQGR